MRASSFPPHNRIRLTRPSRQSSIADPETEVSQAPRPPSAAVDRVFACGAPEHRTSSATRARDKTSANQLAIQREPPAWYAAPLKEIEPGDADALRAEA